MQWNLEQAQILNKISFFKSYTKWCNATKTKCSWFVSWKNLIKSTEGKVCIGFYQVKTQSTSKNVYLYHPFNFNWLFRISGQLCLVSWDKYMNSWKMQLDYQMKYNHTDFYNNMCPTIQMNISNILQWCLWTPLKRKMCWL